MARSRFGGSLARREVTRLRTLEARAMPSRKAWKQFVDQRLLSAGAITVGSWAAPVAVYKSVLLGPHDNYGKSARDGSFRPERAAQEVERAGTRPFAGQHVLGPGAGRAVSPGVAVPSR